MFTRSFSTKQLLLESSAKQKHLDKPVTNKKHVILHVLNCKSSFLIYLKEYIKCGIQYIRKSKIKFNLKLDNHLKDIRSPTAIPACKHFNQDHEIKQ